MAVRRFLKFALAILVTAGLALAPLPAPAAANGPSMDDRMDMSAMSADMSCCPDGQKSKDCQDCPLVALCILKTSQAGPSMTLALPVRHAVRAAHAALNDASSDGLVHPPPDHPPRLLA